MIWLNPWAWLGVAGVALPILIHLLGRGHARILKFPTLRFLAASRLLPTQRSRIQDPLLLAVRSAILALAAIALAQPLLLTTGRRAALDRGLARAVVVDTSTSMRRTMASGVRLLDSARALAKGLAADAKTSIVVETVDPAASLSGATAWIARQERRGEIVIISDFQRGQIERDDFAELPTSVGIALQQLLPSDTGTAASVRVLASGRAIDARMSATPAGADVEWSAAVPDAATHVPVALFAGPEQSSALAILDAAAATIALPLLIDTTRAIGIVFTKYPQRDAVIASLQPARAEWELALAASLRRAKLTLTASGHTTIDGTGRFVLVTSADPSSVDAAAIVTMARRATAIASSPLETEPGSVAAAELKRWERPALESPPSQHRPLDDDAPSDGRWLWAAVLVLLVIEWRVRLREPASVTTSEERARAA